MRFAKLVQLAVWVAIPAGLLGAAPPAEPTPAPAPAAAPTPAPRLDAPKASAPAAAAKTEAGADKPEATAPESPAKLETLTPEERLRRAEVDAPGKVCETPDEAATKAATARLILEAGFQRAAGEMTTQGVLIAGSYWGEQRMEAERLIRTAVDDWAVPRLVHPFPPDPSPMHASRLCKVLAARDPARCRDLDPGGDIEFVCRAWLTGWNARETGLCPEAPEEMHPLCRLGKDGDTKGCAGATERVRRLCRDFDSALTFDWQWCDKPGRSSDCTGSALVLALFQGEKACDALGKGAAAGSHRSKLAASCRAILNADATDCLEAEWKGEGELTRHHGLKLLVRDAGPELPLPQPVLAPRILGGPAPSLTVFGASKTASVCHTTFVVKQEGAEDWTRAATYSVGPHPMGIEPIAMDVSVDPWMAQVSFESLCVPTLVWTRTRRVGRE